MVVPQAVKSKSLMCKSNSRTSMWWFGDLPTWSNQANNQWQNSEKLFSGLIILKDETSQDVWKGKATKSSICPLILQLELDLHDKQFGIVGDQRESKTFSFIKCKSMLAFLLRCAVSNSSDFSQKIHKCAFHNLDHLLAASWQREGDYDVFQPDSPKECGLRL